MAKKAVETPKNKFDRVLPWLLVIASAIAVFCAGVITYEKIALLQNPNHSMICDVNPIISCGSVMSSDQASAFGFPNPFLGLVGFSIVATLGVVLLSGVTLKRWIWRGLQAGLTFALAFCLWLFYQAVYDINALCIWCMIVWTATIAMFWYTLLYNLRKGHIGLPAKFAGFSAFLQRHHVDILISFYIVLIALILHRFWYYFGTIL